MSDALSNIPEYTVGEISVAVKRALEEGFGRVRVRGEISGFKRYASGHLYYALKDAGGSIDAVTWKSGAARLGMKPEDGVEVIATGRITTHGERSKYQLIVERMEYAGAGALLARIEALRLRLAAEGLFDAARKRAWPLLPNVVGVVTSPSGAVLHDIRTTVLRRFPRPILLWPVLVQGEAAPAQIAAAIAGFDAIEPGGPVPRPDVLIVARGGGSVEDLMAFNDEAVVRAAAACRIPLISAVGHETDHTLIDLAADRRAPTPTAAAELAVPSLSELAAQIAGETARLQSALNRILREGRLHLNQARLPDLPALLDTARQRLDDRSHRLGLALPNLLGVRRGQLMRAERALPDPRSLVPPRRHRLDTIAGTLAVAARTTVDARRLALVRIDRSLPPPRTLAQYARTVLATAAAALDSARRSTLAARRATGDALASRLTPAPLRAKLREAGARLAGTAALLEAVSHTAVLGRGYALVSDRAGHPVTAAAAVTPGIALTLTFADGIAEVRASPKAAETRQGRLTF